MALRLVPFEPVEAVDVEEPSAAGGLERDGIRSGGILEAAARGDDDRIASPGSHELCVGAERDLFFGGKGQGRDAEETFHIDRAAARCGDRDRNRCIDLGPVRSRAKVEVPVLGQTELGLNRDGRRTFDQHIAAIGGAGAGTQIAIPALTRGADGQISAIERGNHADIAAAVRKREGLAPDGERATGAGHDLGKAVRMRAAHHCHGGGRKRDLGTASRAADPNPARAVLAALDPDLVSGGEGKRAARRAYLDMRSTQSFGTVQDDVALGGGKVERAGCGRDEHVASGGFADTNVAAGGLEGDVARPGGGNVFGDRDVAARLESDAAVAARGDRALHVDRAACLGGEAAIGAADALFEHDAASGFKCQRAGAGPVELAIDDDIARIAARGS